MKKHAAYVQQGFTLIEFIVVAVLIALALIGILGYVGRARDGKSIQVEANAINLLIVRGLRYNSSGYNGGLRLQRDMVRSHQVPIPPFTIVEGYLIKNQWGSSLSFHYNGRSLIVEDLVPSYACYGVISAVVSSHKDASTYINVNGKTFRINVSYRDMAAACTQESNNRVMFQVSRMGV